MEFLSKDMIFYIGLRVDLKELTKLSRLCRRMNRMLCGNEEFWKVKYGKDFTLDELHEYGRGISFKTLYRETLSIVKFMRFVYDEFLNSYVSNELIMTLYNKVFKYFTTRKGRFHSWALVQSLVVMTKGSDESFVKCIFYIFSYLMRQYKGERITKEKFIELTK
jgi:hypothetical protein